MDKIKIYIELSDCYITLHSEVDENFIDEYYLEGEPKLNESNIVGTHIEITNDNYHVLIDRIRSSFPMTEDLDECTENSLNSIQGLIAVKTNLDERAFTEIFYLTEPKNEFIDKLNNLINEYKC